MDTKPLASKVSVDRIHQNLSSRLSAPALWFDNFFGAERSDEESASTLLRYTGSISFREGQGSDYGGRVKARLSLPNLKERFSLVFTSDDEDLEDSVVEDIPARTRLTDDNRDNTLALKFSQKKSREYSITHQLGADLDDGITPKVKSRFRYTQELDDINLVRLAQTLFWEDDEGFGEETRIDHEYWVNPDNLIRTTAKGLLSEKSDGLEWLGEIQWLSSLSNKRALAGGFYFTGVTRPLQQIIEYTAFVKYRQRLFKPWIYGEIKPEVAWLREEGFEPLPGIVFTVELQFGDI